jgi:hypothetical protein
MVPGIILDELGTVVNVMSPVFSVRPLATTVVTGMLPTVSVA